MLKIYGFSKVNAGARGHTRDLRVLWALEEMQLPFEIVGLDHPAHDLSTDAYRQLSPFEQIPAIDDNGQVISESGAILIHLARKSGKLSAADPAGETQVLRWSVAALNTVEMPLLGLMVLGWTTKSGCDTHREFLTGWCHRVLRNLDRWMEGREFIATDEFTIADILMAHVLTEVRDDEMMKPYARVAAYRERCLARPAWQKTMERYCERVVAA